MKTSVNVDTLVLLVESYIEHLKIKNNYDKLLEASSNIFIQFPEDEKNPRCYITHIDAESYDYLRDILNGIHKGIETNET